MAPTPDHRIPEQSPSPSEHETVGGAHEAETVQYEHSGIQERHGTIPLWLAVVVVVLIVWSIYYTIRYWSAE